jgi:putative transposase
VKAELALSERTYVCMMCGLVLDRDVNAARNLAALGGAMIAGSGPETVNARGGQGVLALPVKRQPGTAQVGQSGTALPQGRTAVRELTNAH